MAPADVAAQIVKPARGVTHHGRFRIRPEAGTEYLSNEGAAQSENFLFDKIGQRLSSTKSKLVPYLLIAHHN